MLSSLFSEALRALVTVMFTPGGEFDEGWPPCPEGTGTSYFPILLQEEDNESLMQAFLSEALYIMDAHSVVICGADIKCSDGGLDARVTAVPFDPCHHAGGADVKGISFSGMQIMKEGTSYVLEILFDV